MDAATLHVGVSVLQVFVIDNLFVVKNFFSNAFDRDRISIFYMHNLRNAECPCYTAISLLKLLK